MVFFFNILHILRLKDTSEHETLKDLGTAVPVRPRDIVRYRNVAGPAWPARKKCPSPSPRPPAILWDEQLGNSRATHRARLLTSRGIETFPTGYTELTRRPRIPGAQEKEGRRSTAIRGRRLYVKWIRQRYASPRWIAFPALPVPRPGGPGPGAARSSRLLLGTGSSVDPGRLPAKAPVALIAFSKSRLIDEFRRRVARK